MTVDDACPRRRQVLSVVATAVASALAPTWAAATEAQRPLRWVVDPQQALQLIRDGALLLDARGSRRRPWQRTLAGAIALDWEQLARADPPLKGLLLDDDTALAQRLQALGVSNHRAVVIAADPDSGWGEDGRLVWSLRTLGHSRAVMVDGGIPALRDAGDYTVAPVAPNTDFVVARVPSLLASREELRADLLQRRLMLLDAREAREYEGATPYGEARGGHIPGARHLGLRDLLAPDGHLRPRAEIERLLAQRGVTRDSEVVAYCTGGIRSAWLVAVLVDMGYRARNYAGSIWEWAAAPAAEYPLVRGR